MDETTPLFPGQADHEDENSIPTRRTSSSRIVTILIWSSVIISALTFLYNLTVYLVVKLSPYNDFLRWGTRDSVEALLPLSFLCAAVSLFGIFKLTVLNGSAWPLVSLILDPLIVFLFLLNPALDSYWIADWEHCDASRPDFPAPEFGAGCERFANAIRAVILVGLVFQMAILTLHLVFFICDVVLVVKRLRQQSAGWRFPTGQFTVEFTIKILRQRDEEV